MSQTQAAESIASPNMQIILIVQRRHMTDARKDIRYPTVWTEFITTEKRGWNLGGRSYVINIRSKTQNTKAPHKYVTVFYKKRQN